jgi:hypothetical protein
MKWLNRDLIVGPYLTLVLSEKEFHKVLRHCQIPREDFVPWLKSGTADACMHWFNNPKKQLVCVVALQVREGLAGAQIAALLVHEAVHIWQQFRERIGEHSPSTEFEAYAIQAISQRLMYAYAERVAK